MNVTKLGSLDISELMTHKTLSLVPTLYFYEEATKTTFEKEGHV